MDEQLKELAIADPVIADRVMAGLKHKAVSAAFAAQPFISRDIIWAFSMERSFGEAVADGYVEMAEAPDADGFVTFHRLVRDAGEKGPTFGRLMATSLVPVLKTGDRTLLASFKDTVGVMLGIGEYALPPALEALTFLLGQPDAEAVFAFLGLLKTAFSLDLTYNRGRYLSNLIPKAVCSFSVHRRSWQTRQFARIIGGDYHLADAFVDAMAGDLAMLDPEALDAFVTRALGVAAGNRKAGARFLGLKSTSGIDACAGLQRSVAFARVSRDLNRYVKARTGLGVTVQPISSLPPSDRPSGVSAASDGRHIFLPDEIGLFDNREDNQTLYKLLTRLEAGYHEFGTFDFDLERAREAVAEQGLRWPDTGMVGTPAGKRSDMGAFVQQFPNPALSRDLFTLFEHGRQRLLYRARYPGIFRQAWPALKKDMACILSAGQSITPLYALYQRVALGAFPEKSGLPISERLAQAAHRFETAIANAPEVETVAVFVCRLYPDMDVGRPYAPMMTPFGLRPRPELVFRSFQTHEALSHKLQARLTQHGIKVYRADIRKKLTENNGYLSNDDIRTIMRRQSGPEHDSPEGAEPSDLLEVPDIDLHDLLPPMPGAAPRPANDGGPVYRYHEWDTGLGDYLQDHVMVRERALSGSGNGLYGQVLEQRKGLVGRIRRSFEFLKPQDLSLLRKWPEGDEFDYRAMLDFAVDKLSGIMPSDRLYIKRVKKERDVSVLLLVDLSRSTANPVNGSGRTVLDVEKEAIVLLCEALSVVGDSFSISGFSGSGRFGVDYYVIKDFTDRMDDTVKRKISAMSPRRSTRMGAAIRHATQRLDQAPSKIRLLMILGDGFPNDAGYKEEYAIADTRRALSEARAKGIYAHSITVNMACDARLDDVYGRINHNVISDVRELPDRLLRIYSSLTRH